MTPAINEARFLPPKPAVCEHCGQDFSAQDSLLIIRHPQHGWEKGYAKSSQETFYSTMPYPTWVNMPHCAVCLQPAKMFNFWQNQPPASYRYILPPESADQTEIKYDPNMPPWTKCPHCDADLTEGGRAMYFSREERWYYNAYMVGPDEAEVGESTDSEGISDGDFHCSACDGIIPVESWEWY